MTTVTAGGGSVSSGEKKGLKIPGDLISALANYVFRTDEVTFLTGPVFWVRFLGDSG